MNDNIRSQFPILSSKENGKDLIYLDSAATALKPQCVIDAVVQVMNSKSANVHRAVHRLGDLATQAYEASRQVVADFIGAQNHEIVFTRNTTEALNLVALGCQSPGRTLVHGGDHHSNLLPWHERVVRIPPQADGGVDWDKFEGELKRRDVALVSMTHVSNVLGIKNDVSMMAKVCHEYGARFVVDAAQSIPHEPIDVFEMDCDFLAFSGHKLGGPTGAGVLYGKADELEKLGWYLRGGSMVERVHTDRIVLKDIPWRLEAGTPAIESVVGLAAAIEFLDEIGMTKIRQHQLDLVQYARQLVNDRLPQFEILGSKHAEYGGPISLVQRVVNPHLLARSLSDRYNICVRSGFHCAQPLHEFLGIPASLRISFYIYNTQAEIDLVISALERLIDVAS